MLPLDIYGRVCRVCLGEKNKLLSLNDTHEEYSLTTMDVLHQSVPGLEATTVFPVPGEICETCRDQLLMVFQFQRSCLATNAKIKLMWQEASQNLQRHTKEEDREQEIKFLQDLETTHELDPIKLEASANENPLEKESELLEKTEELANKSESPKLQNDVSQKHECSFCLKSCRTNTKLQSHISKYHVEDISGSQNGKEDEEDDDKPLICLINSNKHLAKENQGASEEHGEYIVKSSRSRVRKEKIYTCEMCLKQFSSEGFLQKHFKNKHKSVKDNKPPGDMQLAHHNSLSESNVEENLNSTLFNGTEFEAVEGENDFEESDASTSDVSKGGEEKADVTPQSKESDTKLKTRSCSKKHDCTECNASFRFEKQLERHLKKHTDAHRFVCLVCSDRFKYPFMLQKHVEKHHPEASGQRKVEEDKKCEQEKLHACKYCSASYTNIGGLAQHMSKKHAEIVPFKCDKCDKTFVVEEHLKIHTNRHMGIKNFKCEQCDKSFSFKFAMKQHMRIHTGDLNYLCTLCGKKFYRPSNLRQHMQRHGDDKPYTCPHCPKRFKCPSDRYIHLMSHQEGKNHVCSTCGARFSRVDTMHQHQILHTGEKPYKCDQCPMAFPRLMNLNRHLRTHTGEKPYKCKYCDKAYAQSNDLNKHLRTHVGENTYMCAQCPAAFKYQADLRSHEWDHYRKQKQENEEGDATNGTNVNKVKDYAVREKDARHIVDADLD